MLWIQEKAPTYGVRPPCYAGAQTETDMPTLAGGYYLQIKSPVLTKSGSLSRDGRGRDTYTKMTLRTGLQQFRIRHHSSDSLQSFFAASLMARRHARFLHDTKLSGVAICLIVGGCFNSDHPDIRDTSIFT